MSKFTEKVYFIRYTCRTSDGSIVEQFDDTSNLFCTWGDADKAKKAHLDVFNVDCKKGVWRGVVKTL